MKKSNAIKDMELLNGLYNLGIEMKKLEEELRSNPPSNPQIEKNLRIIGLFYPIWAGTLFSSGKRPNIRRSPRIPVRHVVMNPMNGRKILVPGLKPPKKRRLPLSPKKHAACPWITGVEFNSPPALPFLPETSPRLLHTADEIPSKEMHYKRNQFMGDLPQSPEMAVDCGWDDRVGAACHQFLSPDRSNIKFVSPDGHSEVIFDRDGQIVTASEDYGTYNFVDSRKDPIGHFYQDVIPWILWGNDEKDSTDLRQRLRALVVFEDSVTALPRVAMEPAEEGDESRGGSLTQLITEKDHS